MNVLLRKNYARTNTFKFTFFSRIMDMWNTMPLPILVRQQLLLVLKKE